MDAVDSSSMGDVSDFFLRLTQTELPRLVAIFTPGFATHKDRQRLILFTLETLIQSSHSVGFDNLAALFQSLQHHLPQEWPIPQEDRRRLITIFNEIRRLAEMMEVEEGMGVYTGSRDMATNLAHALRGEFYHQCRLLTLHLQSLMMASPESDLPFIYGQAADTAATIWQLLECSGHTLCVPLILMATDVLHRASINHLVIPPALLNRLQESITLVEQTCHASPDGEQVNFLLQKIRDCLKTGGTCSDEEIDQTYALVQGINPVLQETLSAEHLQELAMAKKQGLNRVQLLVHMERDPLITERFLHWLPNNCKIITNRSISHHNPSDFLFLLVTALSPTELTAHLRQLDPRALSIHLKS
ncbi:MAG: hypothetical protein G8345_08795 [Magnetococcales bacterium]|nr:hypothetical protein [Magnetococcales bacterium]NGZ26972.1 hypothetical protein [Magnetococcales bacterium]